MQHDKIHFLHCFEPQRRARDYFDSKTKEHFPHLPVFLALRKNRCHSEVLEKDKDRESSCVVETDET